MSTKIFPFKPRKIKPPKAPDPEIERIYERDKAAWDRLTSLRREERRIMHSLYAEDLARRAKKLEKPCPCCGLPMDKYLEALVRQRLAKDPQRLDRDKRELETRLDKIISGGDK